MGKISDISGMKFGKLTVLNRTEEKRSGRYLWNLKCDCGNTHKATSELLKRGVVKSCGCLKYSHKDLTEKSFGRLIVERRIDNDSGKGHLWECKCECGNTHNVSAGHLNSGSVKSCGCLTYESKNIKHGAVGTPAYESWASMKFRVTNPRYRYYEKYSKMGICDELKEDFNKIIEYAGPYPDDGKKYTIDRIDNNKGYYKGNIRWATSGQQSQNKGKNVRNKSGKTGVFSKKSSSGDVIYHTANYSLNGKSKTKTFSVGKFGEELAYFAACEWRDVSIMRLNLIGCEYSDTHGE